MRWLIFWCVMLTWIAIASNTPSFFPEWVQVAIWACGITATSILGLYAIHIQIKNSHISSIETTNQNLETKITELKARLRDIEPKSRHSTLTNSELRSKTLTHVQGIKDLLEKESGDSIQSKSNLDAIYKNRFRAESSVLRDELWKRLPDYCCPGESCEAEKICRAAYQSEAIYPMILEALIADLEHLAHSLRV